MEKQLDQPGVARVTLEDDMDYTDLIERLRNSLSNGINEEAADAIEALVKERDELAALRKQIDELQPAAWHFSGKPLYIIEGIKK